MSEYRLTLWKEMRSLGSEITYRLIPCEWQDRDFIEQPLEVMSYGGGTQSTAMLLMIRDGLIPRPDIIIHADTGSELPETVEFVEIAKEWVERELKLPFAIVRSHRGALHEDYFRIGAIPIIGARSCTDNFKVLPQRRLIRKIVGNGRGKILARCWLGITTDEARRKPSPEHDSSPKWIGLSFPLLDHHPTSREECIKMNENAGWEVVKSGCWCCPYQGSNAWRRLKANHPDLFQLSIELEENKFEKKGGKIGLHQEKRLRDLDDLNLEDSSCDSDAGCFL